MLFEINAEALKSYVSQLSMVASEAGVDSTMDIAGLLTLPGILEPMRPDEAKAQKVKEFVLELTARAIENLEQMRQAEGAELKADLLSHCQAISEQLEQIRQRKDVVLAEYHVKLSSRVEQLLAGAKLEMDQAVLAREVAVFTERSDISEELTRLESHLKQFAENCDQPGQAGRRLEFLGQEMLREANTIGSKASDVQIAHAVVEIKCSIDRLKEQVQNIE